MDFVTSSSLIAISIVFVLICILLVRPRKPSDLPPGPYGPPIIGNILHLGSEPHRSLSKLAQKYGPVMSLKLGSMTSIVVSSSEAARVVLQKHDSSLSGRVVSSAVSVAHQHGEFSVVFISVGKQWRKLRKICKEQMFSTPMLDASHGLRREKLQKLLEYVGERCESGGAVDVGEAAFTTTMNLMSASLLSREFAAFDSDSSQEMKAVMRGLLKCAGTPNLADFFPLLKHVDPQGILKETRFYFGKLLAIFDEIVDERLKLKSRRGSENKEKHHHHDLVENLIDIHQRDEAQLSRNDIKHLLVDMFVAGTDTTAVTVEWAMAELIRNPTKMLLLRNEVRNFIQENGKVEESDIQRLPYLQAVVKETFRLHPPAPFLIPHKAVSDVQINSYVIPQNAQLLVNVWAIGRDPSIWTDADEFVPERFLNEDKVLDFKGQDFELLPFGSGRRICPGLPLADRMVHQILVTLVGNFEWKFEEEEMDMNENFGITLVKAVSLKAIPTKL